MFDQNCQTWSHLRLSRSSSSNSVNILVTNLSIKDAAYGAVIWHSLQLQLPIVLKHRRTLIIMHTMLEWHTIEPRRGPKRTRYRKHLFDRWLYVTARLLSPSSFLATMLVVVAVLLLLICFATVYHFSFTISFFFSQKVQYLNWPPNHCHVN